MKQVERRKTGGKALPEPRLTKQMILESRRQAMQDFSHLRDARSGDAWVRFQNSVIQLYYDLKPHLDYLKKQGETYISDIEELENKLAEKNKHWSEISNKDFEEWNDYLTLMNQAIHDLNITNIGISQESEEFGQALVNELGVNVPYKTDNFNLDVEDSDLGWIRWQIELQNIRKALRQDRDVVMFVYGPNRMGKTTFALQSCRIVEKGKNQGTIPKKAIVMDNDDFWDAAERPPYSSKHIDEAKKLLYSKEANTSEQIQRKKRFVTDAKNNQFTSLCDTQYYSLDKEFREDKVDIVVRVPERGRFEVYSSSQMKDFERNKDTGKAETPEPLFKGKFPDLKSNDDPLWDVYAEREDEKIVKRDDNDKSQELDKIVEEVKEQAQNPEDRYRKQYNSRDMINADLIASDYYQELSDRDASKVKERVEADLGLPKKMNKE